MQRDDNIKFEVVDNDVGLFPEATPISNQMNTQMNTQMNAQIKQTSSGTFESSVLEFIKLNNPKLYILTPCYGGMCYVNYVNSIMATVQLFQNVGFPIQIEFCKNDSLVSRARNNLIARAMHDKKTTHILFIDADITWDPVDILKLVLSNKPLSGGIYPLKHYNWEKLVKDDANPYNTNIIQSWINKKNNSQLKDMISDANLVQHNLLRYNINYLDSYLSIENNMAKVKHLATGFMMIQRDLLEKMMKAFPSTKYVDDVGFLQGTENDYAYALFDCGVEEGHYFSEDWLFCHRWSKMGGSIWADVSINLTHTGTEDYRGCYVASIV